MAIDERTLASLRKALEAKRAEIEANLASMAHEERAIGIEQESEPGFFGEDGSSLAEAERLNVVSEDLSYVLQQVNSALQRMDEGTYGQCLRCGKSIPVERLKALPYAEYDVACQSAIEQEQGIRAGR